MRLFSGSLVIGAASAIISLSRSRPDFCRISLSTPARFNAAAVGSAALPGSVLGAPGFSRGVDVLSSRNLSRGVFLPLSGSSDAACLPPALPESNGSSASSAPLCLPSPLMGGTVVLGASRSSSSGGKSSSAAAGGIEVLVAIFEWPSAKTELEVPKSALSSSRRATV